MGPTFLTIPVGGCSSNIGSQSTAMSENEEQEQNLAQLRKQADDGKAARRELEEARRELAFAKAGVDVESKIGKLLLRSYDGELDVEAIKAEALEVGAIKASGEPTEDPVVDASESQERQELASEAGTPSTMESESPYTTALHNFEDARREGTPVDNAAAQAFLHIVDAARKGDGRVLL